VLLQVHWLAVHVPLPQENPQVAQWSGLLVMSASHWLPSSPSQLAAVAAQAINTHALAVGRLLPLHV
jgi:hypothetical protein